MSVATLALAVYRLGLWTEALTFEPQFPTVVRAADLLAELSGFEIADHGVFVPRLQRWLRSR